MMSFSIIVAVDAKLGIGRNSQLPWHLPADLKYFKKITTLESSPEKINAVIMGRKTWDSIPEKFRPLEQRLNIVISRQDKLALPPGVIHVDSLNSALDLLDKKSDTLREIFVIGGAQIFNEAVQHLACQKIYLTQIDDQFVCDTYFPDVLPKYTEVSRKGPVVDQGISLVFLELVKSK